MQKSLVTSALLAALLIAGCSATPAAAPGPAGPQGQPGEQGTAGRDSDRDRDRDRDKDQDHQSNAAPCPAGEHLFTDKDGRAICARD
jgi:hypothetical protein